MFRPRFHLRRYAFLWYIHICVDKFYWQNFPGQSTVEFWSSLIPNLRVERYALDNACCPQKTSKSITSYSQRGYWVSSYAINGNNMIGLKTYHWMIESSMCASVVILTDLERSLIKQNHRSRRLSSRHALHWENPPLCSDWWSHKHATWDFQVVVNLSFWLPLIVKQVFEGICQFFQTQNPRQETIGAVLPCKAWSKHVWASNPKVTKPKICS